MVDFFVCSRAYQSFALHLSKAKAFESRHLEKAPKLHDSITLILQQYCLDGIWGETFCQAELFNYKLLKLLQLEIKFELELFELKVALMLKWLPLHVSCLCVLM